MLPGWGNVPVPGLLSLVSSTLSRYALGNFPVTEPCSHVVDGAHVSAECAACVGRWLILNSIPKTVILFFVRSRRRAVAIRRLLRRHM